VFDGLAVILERLNALAGNGVPGSNTNPDAMDRRSIAEFLEALIISQVWIFE
jgi:hypothetical protein